MRLAPGWRPWVLPPLLAGVAATFLLPLSLLAGYAAGLLLLLSGLLALFFRDPERDPGPGIVSAADGLIQETGRTMVTFLNVHNVHVIRAPYAGRIRSVERFSGGHLPAFLGGSKHNAGVAIELETRWGVLEVRLVAGLIARRAVPWVTPGEQVTKGQRIGLITFGSRVDVALPDGAKPEVQRGERVWAGQTMLAQAPEAAD